MLLWDNSCLIVFPKLCKVDSFVTRNRQIFSLKCPEIFFMIKKNQNTTMNMCMCRHTYMIALEILLSAVIKIRIEIQI